MISLQVHLLKMTTTILEPIVEEDAQEADDTKAKDNQPWVEVIRGNRLCTNDLDISFTYPSILDGEMEVIIEE